MKKINVEFPKKFLWGSGTAAQQIESDNNKLLGGKAKTIWDVWYEENKYSFFEQQPTRNYFLKNYKQDIRIAKELNFNSLRISISWARLMPNGKTLNPEGVKFYHDVIDEMIKQGIEPILCLFHFDMPMWAMEKGGWDWKGIILAFKAYAKQAFALFGTKVTKWYTFNEPIVPIEGQYWQGFHYPGKIDFQAGIRGLYNTILSHHHAVEVFRQAKILNGKIGAVLSITPAIPRGDNQADKQAAKVAEALQAKCFLDPFLKGEFCKETEGVLKKHGLWQKNLYTLSDVKLIKNTKMDMLGINYYAPLRVKALDYLPNFDDKQAITPHTHFFALFDKPGKRMNIYRGWEIRPKSIYDILKNIQDNYNNIPCMICENGMGVEKEERFIKNGKINDDYRIDFHQEHLYWVGQAIKEGSNCFGYHMWTYIDNWSWMNAYKNRYGFVSLDLKTGKRTFKKSASWISKVAKDNGFEVMSDKIAER